MLEIARFTPAQFVALLVGNRQRGAIINKAIPKIFYELKAFRTTEFEERSEFSIHTSILTVNRRRFN